MTDIDIALTKVNESFNFTHQIAEDMENYLRVSKDTRGQLMVAESKNILLALKICGGR